MAWIMALLSHHGLPKKYPSSQLGNGCLFRGLVRIRRGSFSNLFQCRSQLSENTRVGRKSKAPTVIFFP